jgi:hypothetical protein
MQKLDIQNCINLGVNVFQVNDVAAHNGRRQLISRLAVT